MNGIGSQIVVVATAIIGVALVATLVSRNANTAGVIKSAGDAFSGALRAATSPLSGSAYMPSTASM